MNMASAGHDVGRWLAERVANADRLEGGKSNRPFVYLIHAIKRKQAINRWVIGIACNVAADAVCGSVEQGLRVL
jgi:hypothetical protein